jgi:hypothetical protein
MGQKSKIDKLPVEVRELIAGLVDNGKTIEEIVLKLHELVDDGQLVNDQVPSKSSVHRHIQKIKKITERMRRSKDIAETVVKELGTDQESKAARLNIEVLHTLILDLSMAAAEDVDEETGELTLTPSQAMQLAKAVDHLAKAEKANADLILKVRDEVKKQAIAAVKKVGTSNGLTKETREQIERELKLL